MSGYTKLFSSILASTVWREDDKTRIVWITLLAMAGKNGVAEGSLPGLADFARVSIPDCQHALQKLSTPDEHSRTKDFDGRRIEPVDGGWLIINHGKYRAKMNADERREYLRVKQREFRQRTSTRRQQPSTNINNRNGRSTRSTQSEADPSPEAVRKNCVPTAGPVKEQPDPQVKEFIVWFSKAYKEKRNGADYLVRWEKDSAIVKKLLKATTVPHLKDCTVVLLSPKTADDFIIDSDRGIGVLSAKFNWLSNRVAEWRAQQRAN